MTREFWRNRSNRRAVPLSKIQTEVLRLLASHRDPESYVAGATPLNRDATRYSADIGVFHDREERVAVAALDDCRRVVGVATDFGNQPFGCEAGRLFNNCPSKTADTRPPLTYRDCVNLKA